ncbi:MAG: DUF998 domain-containing protein, partial [Candidatus Parcubacteria bacterium]|nr:DUF998 domain-containing protein [Candidatus Parcubacteria bacterium]
MNFFKKRITKILLICGILLFSIYIGIDTLSAILYQGYNYTDQAISELSAIGAPTAWLWIILNFVFQPLLLAFGAGVRLAAGERRNLRLAGTIMMIGGIIGFGWLLFPMNMRGAVGSTTDTMHLVMSAVTVLLFILYISFGSGAKGLWFRLYSILTILLMLGFGIMVSRQ